MSSTNTVWVHGNAFLAEDPDRLKAIWSQHANPALPPPIHRVGWGTYFRAEGLFTWFHISIPVPHDDGIFDPVLETIYFLYEVKAATIMNVDVYDGKKKIYAFSNLNLAGNPDPINPGIASGIINGYNSKAINPHISIDTGVGLSIGVQFSQPLDDHAPSQVLFTAAGATFGSGLPRTTKPHIP